jgi:integrase
LTFVAAFLLQLRAFCAAASLYVLLGESMASISKRGDYQFQALIRRTGHPCQTKTFETRAQAKQWTREVESKMDQGQFQDRRGLRHLTLGQALTRYSETVTPNKRGKVAEVNRIKLLLRHALSKRSLDSLSAHDFCEYRDERKKQVSNSTVRLELALLSHLYTIAINEWRLPLIHELKTVTRPKPNKARSRRFVGDEETRLLNAIYRPEVRSVGVWLEACVRLALETGMRAGEILTMEWDQVNLTDGFIHLSDTKNGSDRTVGLTHDAVAILQKLPRNQGKNVIPNFHDTSGLDRAFKLTCHAAGISNLRFHDLRHEAASRMAPHMKVQDLAKVMGWLTLQMAMRYYNPSDREIVQLVRNASRSHERSGEPPCR